MGNAKFVGDLKPRANDATSLDVSCCAVCPPCCTLLGAVAFVCTTLQQGRINTQRCWRNNMLEVIAPVCKELNFVIYIEVIYDKKIVSLVVFRQLRLTVPEQTKETRLKIGMNFKLQETVPIYWFFTIFNQVKIKLNKAIFF